VSELHAEFVYMLDEAGLWEERTGLIETRDRVSFE
jgi:hypothetical protein